MKHDNPADRAMMICRACRIAILVVTTLWAVGCASNEPSLSGFGLGGSRSVTVGSTFELRLPVAENGARLWRVTSYDSYYLTLAGNTRAETKGDQAFIVLRVLARQPGETSLDVTERLTAEDRIAGKEPRVKTFRIRITP